jgi:hypothetical protein
MIGEQFVAAVVHPHKLNHMTVTSITILNVKQNVIDGQARLFATIACYPAIYVAAHIASHANQPKMMLLIMIDVQSARIAGMNFPRI